MYIRVRVTAGMKRESIQRLSDDSFSISVKEPAEQNMANKRVLEIIAGEFCVPVRSIRIVSGHHAPGKILSIPDSVV